MPSEAPPYRSTAGATTQVVVIGAGQAGLAASRLLTEHGYDHVVLERGRIAERWLSQRWESLRLLTPNWMTRLPHHAYGGPDPQGFMTMPEVAAFLGDYADSFAAPVVEDADVVSVRRCGERFRVVTTVGTWVSDQVIVATGHAAVPTIPALHAGLDHKVRQVTAAGYRRPDLLPDGSILVVGASASGAQIASELAAAGRSVLLSVGRHTRLPRSYRGLDSFWWLDRMGVLDRPVDELPDLEHALREPSLQVSGGGRAVDLATLQDSGVRLLGRLAGVEGSQVRLRHDLDLTTAEADRRLRRLLSRIDRHIRETGLEREVLPKETPPAVRPKRAPWVLDLRAEAVSTVVWATGYHREYPWLHVPVLDANGEIRHRYGVTPVPGLYVVGMRVQTRRSSSFIDGVGRDAELVVDHMRLGRPAELDRSGTGRL